MTPQTPAGFSLYKYIYNVKKAFEDAFYTYEECPIIETVSFAPTSEYEAFASGGLDIKTPAIIIDPYELKTDPSFDEYRQEKGTPHTNTGNLALYLFVRALVLVINNKNTVTHRRVRQLAFDIAGVVTEHTRFGANVGMSQVTHISELQGYNLSNRLIGWTVQWQHSLELEAPDYSNIGIRKAFCDSELEADANDINRLNIPFNEKKLAVSDYREFTDVSTFAAETQPSWSIGEHTSKWWLLFRVEADSDDYEKLANSLGKRTLAVSEPDKDDSTIPQTPALHTYRVTGELEAVSNTHYQIELESDSQVINNLTDDNPYFLKIFELVEVATE